jgi:PKD repeat protein
VDTNANVYVADSGNSAIRKVTPAGVVTTLAGLAGAIGSADGTGSAARFYSPFGLAVDTNGNVIVADSDNFTIRKVTPAGAVTTLAGVPGTSGGANGAGSAARFYYPDDVAVDPAGNLYVADGANNEIRKGLLLPTAQATANPTTGTAPLTVSFTATNRDSFGNTITRWSWSFGDGATSTLQNPSHIYQAGGTFQPALFATNNLGGTVGSGVPSITVTAPTLAVNANPTGGTIPLTVQFTADSTDSGGSAITSWNWSFGDGATSTLQNPSHTYWPAASSGYYPTLTATNSHGFAINSYAPSIFVYPPTAQYTASPLEGAAPLAVQFNGPGVDSAGNTITNWSWAFGDGATSALQNPSHTYSTGALTTLRLTSPTATVPFCLPPAHRQSSWLPIRV